jgi:hypothetical protein
VIIHHPAFANNSVLWFNDNRLVGTPSAPLTARTVLRLDGNRFGRHSVVFQLGPRILQFGGRLCISQLPALHWMFPRGVWQYPSLVMVSIRVVVFFLTFIYSFAAHHSIGSGLGRTTLGTFQNERCRIIMLMINLVVKSPDPKV